MANEPWVCSYCVGVCEESPGYSEPRDPDAQCSGCGVRPAETVRLRLAVEQLRQQLVGPRAERARSNGTERMMEAEWLTAAEAAHHLGLTRKGLYQAVRRGEVPVHRLGERRMRFKRNELSRVMRVVPALKSNVEDIQ